MSVSALPSPLCALLIACYDADKAGTVLSVKSVTVNGQKYKVGCVFVCDVTCTEEMPLFVLVKHIIQVKYVQLVCGVMYHAIRFNVHCHAYEVE